MAISSRSLRVALLVLCIVMACMEEGHGEDGYDYCDYGGWRGCKSFYNRVGGGGGGGGEGSGYGGNYSNDDNGGIGMGFGMGMGFGFGIGTATVSGNSSPIDEASKNGDKQP
ncbi:glycine-rich cell wall structural protein 2-like [Solanum pennellii]|uniref:Glycine-rich cell wall structural protein 2-like n=1 Tax=Solanum pennellii TaxID=28526 RepID=A0ABM1G1Z3_SOLPN|nr:glycine-rich cell wall structural protein 2-like [Solanum pennellii]